MLCLDSSDNPSLSNNPSVSDNSADNLCVHIQTTPMMGGLVQLSTFDYRPSHFVDDPENDADAFSRWKFGMTVRLSVPPHSVLLLTSCRTL